MSTDLNAKQNSDEQADLALGVRYYPPGSRQMIQSSEADLYTYQVFIGATEVEVPRGDCLYWLSHDRKTAHLSRGGRVVQSPHFATLIRGYSPEEKTCTLNNGTVLPYINGCSTKQIFPPDRPGDPTWQMLFMPPHTAEQAHHIHSTARCVYVLKGTGYSVVGSPGKLVTKTLEPGMVCVLDKMCPHHFETRDSSLLVLPVHVWSTVKGAEFNHPMFNGTFDIS